MDTTRDLASVLRVFDGSDGEATKRLYAQLEQLGSDGVIAMNVFRAMKASARAKVYRGGVPGRGSYRGMAYDRKQWSINQLVAALELHGLRFGIRWGWAEDPDQPVHRWVIYVDLPTGQVSFHTQARGRGLAYAEPWDGIRDAGPGRICRWCAALLTSAQGAVR